VMRTAPMTMTHPPPVTIRPIFLWRPDRVRGMPVALEIRLLALETPVSRFQEKPPPFMWAPPLGGQEVSRQSAQPPFPTETPGHSPTMTRGLRIGFH
jgi:hypothetical protein